MPALLTSLIDLVYLAAAVGAFVLAASLVANQQESGRSRVSTAIAIGVSGLWAVGVLLTGSDNHLAQILLCFSYLACLLMLYQLFAVDQRDKNVKPVRPVVGALALVEVLHLALIVASVSFAEKPQALALIGHLVTIFRLLFCIGALVLVHNLFAGSSPQVRAILRWPASALAVLWGYDLNLYTIGYLMAGIPESLLELRGAAMLVFVLLLALGSMRNESDVRFKPSRSFAFQSFSLLAIGAYLLTMVLGVQAISYAGFEFERSIQIVFIVIASAAALALLPSRRLRSWLRVTTAKHLFQHRYDYRAEWLRFTDTIGRAGPEAAPLHERIVQSVADITDSPAGVLLTPREDGCLSLDARWQWAGLEVPARALAEEAAQFFSDRQYILDLDDVRNGSAPDVPASVAPDWLLEDARSWAMVPLLHYERLVGVVVLARPPVRRRLDWEDFDLLRVVGRQLASYLAEQASQDALGEAHRFEEFNRRNAFVMHDIKNLASQLSLLASNAEKHAEKPEFRADMLVTLRNSTDKLQALLQRLGRYGAKGGETRVPVRLDTLVKRMAKGFAGRHNVVPLVKGSCTVLADPDGLEQALVHLVQNAVEASAPAQPVMCDLRSEGACAVLQIIDSGSGMNAEFIRNGLFKPFQSTKAGGFGIGAFEARELVRAMGGQIDVESRENIGSRFIIRLPLADAGMAAAGKGPIKEVA